MVDKISITAALICLASITTAQTVTLGTFGYITDETAGSGLHIAALQFANVQSNAPVYLYNDDLPVGSTIYTYDAVDGYSNATYEVTFDFGTFQNTTNWNGNGSLLDLGRGKGYWVKTPSAMSTIFSGDVPMDDSFQTPISMGLQILSYPYPVDRVVTNMDMIPSVGDTIYTYDLVDGYSNSTYEVTFDFGTFQNVTNWSKPAMSIKAGEGFWYKSVTDKSWTAYRPY